MSRKAHNALLLLAAVLFACAWHVSQADPFIPVGSDPGGAGDEASLFGQTTGFTWRSTSLIYFYVVIPDATFPNDTSLDTVKKAIFFPPVDKIAKLTIPGTYTELVLDSAIPDGTYIYASGFGKESVQKNYLKRVGVQSYTVGSYSLVVEMDRGNVTALTWIDGCGECECAEKNQGTQASNSLSCPDSVCISNNCGINVGDCTKKGENTCDMKIFLAWVGTDARGRPCTSAGSLPYNFLQFGLTPAYRAAAGVDDQYLFNISSIGSSKPTS